MRLVLAIGLFASSLIAGPCSSIQTGSSLWGPTGNAAVGSTRGISWGGFVAAAADSTLRRDISGDPVDSRSATWMANFNGTLAPPNSVHTTDVDFGGDKYSGYNIHYVHGNAQRRIVMRDNPSPRESYGGDPGTFPMPFAPQIQWLYGPFSRPWDGVYLKRYIPADQVMLVVDVDNCLSYETYGTYDDLSSISTAARAVFNLLGGDRQRPYNVTGAGVSGICFMCSLLRHEEWTAQVIPHAIQVTGLPFVSNVAMTGAATHAQCCGAYNPNLLPFGGRIRLKASYSSASWDPTGACDAYVTALKKYGLVFVDGGIRGEVRGETQYVWNPSSCAPITPRTYLLLNDTTSEVVETGPVYCWAGGSGCPDGPAPTGSVPVISSLAATPSTALGSPVLVSWTATGNTDDSGIETPTFITWGTGDHLGTAVNPVITGHMLTIPTGAGTWIPATGTYALKLTVQNRYGYQTATVTVTIT